MGRGSEYTACLQGHQVDKAFMLPVRWVLRPVSFRLSCYPPNAACQGLTLPLPSPLGEGKET